MKIGFIGLGFLVGLALALALHGPLGLPLDNSFVNFLWGFGMTGAGGLAGGAVWR